MYGSVRHRRLVYAAVRRFCVPNADSAADFTPVSYTHLSILQSIASEMNTVISSVANVAGSTVSAIADVAILSLIHIYIPRQHRTIFSAVQDRR